MGSPRLERFWKWMSQPEGRASGFSTKVLKPDTCNLTLPGYAAPEVRGRAEGLLEVTDVLFQGVRVAAQ
jgi:hypothetical protein